MNFDAKALETWIRWDGFKNGPTGCWDVYEVSNRFVMFDYAPTMVSIVVYYDASTNAIVWRAFDRLSKRWAQDREAIVPLVCFDMQKTLKYWMYILEQYSLHES